MKLRFGEFPKEHHFLLIARPFVEWTFKFFGWLIVVAILQFAQDRTGNQVLLYVKWFAYLLVLLFIGSFVDWIFSFKRYKSVSGAKLVELAKRDIHFDSDAKQRTNEKKIRSIWIRARRVFVVLISLLLMLGFSGVTNVVADKVIDSLVEFQRRAK
ncbi:hypothetical protein AB7M63_002267 [Bradyrhizobium japonicum]